MACGCWHCRLRPFGWFVGLQEGAQLGVPYVLSDQLSAPRTDHDSSQDDFPHRTGHRRWIPCVTLHIFYQEVASLVCAQSAMQQNRRRSHCLAGVQWAKLPMVEERSPCALRCHCHQLAWKRIFTVQAPGMILCKSSELLGCTKLLSALTNLRGACQTMWLTYALLAWSQVSARKVTCSELSSNHAYSPGSSASTLSLTFRTCSSARSECRATMFL
jgi:hypothetical protein